MDKKSSVPQKFIMGFLLAGALIWCGMFLLEPMLANGDRAQRTWAMGFTLFFSPVCHQDSARCWHIWGNAMPICARCTGIYTGFLVSTIVLFFNRLRFHLPPARGWLWAALLPSAFEFALEKTGLIFGSLTLRAAIGFAAGASIPFFVIPALEELFLKLNKRR
ncbi:DUF2085 domain-containing protein [bacterium]|nr:DUF2085 domain-containing protein [bacterium]